MDYQKLRDALYEGEVDEVEELVNEYLKEGIKAKEILEEGLLKGMDKVSDDFQNEEIFVPEVLIAARAMKSGVEILKPYLNDNDDSTKGTIVIGTVKGDMHDIGKNLVKIMFEGKGLKVIDLGVDVEAERFLEEARKNNADIIACSALLTTTMPELEKVCNLNRKDGSKFKIMVGGAPVNQAFADKIGADAYTPDAASAANKAKELLEG